MHVLLAAGARDRRQLHRQRLQVVAQPLRADRRVQALLEHVVLRRQPDRAVAGVAVARRGAGRGVVGDLAQLLELDLEVVRAGPATVAARALPGNAFVQRAYLRRSRGLTFWPSARR
ncbi:hypothetical protein MOJ79_14685 [Calidifontimicrobium sp. SYSU G02091]|nr:hypothetical protein [Calidifontimicrobium sp. SYSU G02091]